MSVESGNTSANTQIRQYRALLEIADAISAHRDLSSLFKELAKRLRLVVEFDGVNVVLHDPEHNLMRMNVLETPTLPSTLFVTQMPVEEAPAGWVWQTQQALLMTDLDAYESRYPRIIAELKEHSVKTVYVLPLTSAGRRLGALGFGSLREQAWDKDDQEFMQQVAKLVAVAVDNTVNFESSLSAQEQLKRERDRLRLLLEINNAVVSHLDLKELVKTVSASMRDIIPHDAAGIALYDPEQNQLREYINIAYKNMDAFREGEAIPLDGTPAGQVFLTGQSILLRRPDQAKFPADRAQRLVEGSPKSACLAPLISHGRKLGIVGLSSSQEDRFTDGDLELLSQIASQIAIAVENTLNYQRAKYERDRFEMMLEASDAVSASLGMRELLHATSVILRNHINHDFAGMSLYDEESRKFRILALDNPPEHLEEGNLIPLEGTPDGLAFKSRQAVWRERLDLSEFSAPIMQQAYQSGLRSGCSVPLISRDRVIGVLAVGSNRESSITKADVETLQLIANQIASAVENALNFERARKAELEVKRQFEHLRLMLEINNAVVSQLDLRELVRVTSSCLREVLRHDVTGISLYDPETNLFRAYMFDLPDNLPPIEAGTPMELEGSIGGIAFMTGQPVFMSHPDPEVSTSEFDRRLTEAGIRSGGVVPLIAHDRKLGFLGVGSFREAAFSEADQELLCHIANQIAIAFENALAYREIETLKNKLASEKLYLEDEIRTQHNFEELIGESRTFKQILKQVETVAPTDSTVLIRGETGTGKELIARAIHDLSQRRERTLVKINCAAIPTGLLESELFGHEKGAFTGAISQRIGRFELANRGSLFLDEVGDIPLDLQPKLLRVLQEKEFERLGATRTQKVDVRLIAATNCDLEQMVADKKYRSDLYYRLNVFPINIPPLRHRRDDIPALARFFTQKYARQLKKQITAIPSEVMTALVNYHWPGNVRELEHFIERAVILTRGESLEVSLAELKSSDPVTTKELATLENAERDHILRALNEADWVVGGPKGAAARLGMKRTTLQSKMQKLGISRQS